MDYLIGETYDITCAEIRLKEDSRHYCIPVFNHLHADAQFNFPHQHYHIDGRFEIHPRMSHRLNIHEGLTRTVILPEGSNTYDFVGLVSQKLVYVREYTGLLFPSSASTPDTLRLYKDWYSSYIGRSCKGRKCPHFGTTMLEKDGKLECPMHHLTADAGTLKIIPRIA
jgi:hypothetical protein